MEEKKHKLKKEKKSKTLWEGGDGNNLETVANEQLQGNQPRQIQTLT